MKLREFSDRIIAAVKAHVARQVEPLNARLSELDALVKAIPAGPQGERGPAGEPGANGERGEKGEPGLTGKDGAPGKDGRDGLNGKDGAPGERGEKGEPGPRGEKGDAGASGKDGAPGERGPLGEKGLDGKDGAAGRDGKDGRDGREGKDGAPGRDALELDILPAIDEAKAYPRGTWAQHQNGLWRATGATKGMQGWACVVPGLASFSVEIVEERNMVITHALSGAEPVVQKTSLNHPLDRGIYQPEEKYRKGDGVTFGGSWWISLVDEPTQAPGAVVPKGTEEWRLAVKRGRAGKDAK